MDFPTSPPAPSWVDFSPQSVRGLDLLGLRIPVQSIGYTLLDGVTTISPKVRYIGIRTLLADAYRQLPGPPPDSNDSFVAFARSAEAAIALANALVDPDATNVIGIDHARELLEEHATEIPLENTNKQLAVNAYAGPTEDLGLVGIRAGGAPSVDKHHGLPMAKMLRQSWEATTVGKRLLAGEELTHASREDLEAFGVVCDVERLSEGERQHLLAAIFPNKPKGTAVERIRTYALLLHLARELGEDGGRLSERHLFQAVRRPGYEPHQVLLRALDGWLLYHVRDCLAVVHEAVLKQVVLALGDDGARTRADVLTDLLGDEVGFRDLWRDLGLAQESQSILDMHLQDLARTVTDACGEEAEEARGLRRWAGGLNEWAIMDTARSCGTAAVLLLPLSWLLAKRRAERGIREGLPIFDGLSLGGTSRLGMKEVLLPRLAALLEGNAALSEVMAELTTLTVHQHLQIATSRMAQDPNRDVAVLLADGDRWVKRRDYAAGRPASRLYQAVGWLRQLGLLGDEGITPEGEQCLEEALRTLEGAPVE